MSDNEFLARLYRGVERRAPGGDEISRRIAVLSGLGAGSRVLDLGSGASPTARLFAAEFGCEVTCVDSDAAALESLTEAARRDGVEDRIRAMQADMRELDQPEGSFQCVLCEGSVQHLGPSLEDSLRRVRSFLEKDGRLAFTLSARVGRVLPSAVAAFHERLAYPRELTAMCERAGFEPLAVEALPEALVEEHYRTAEQALARLDGADSDDAARLKREIEVFRREGGRTSVNTVLIVARRKEPGEKPKPSRGGA